jgi:D-hydroxyproline dehydrogenase subunit gamma
MAAVLTGLRVDGEQRIQPVEISFQGEPVSAFAGETLAVALLAAGRLVLGSNPVDDTPIGLFCAMGACQECLVLVDGTLVEACRTRVHAGMVVQRAP